MFLGSGGCVSESVCVCVCVAKKKRRTRCDAAMHRAVVALLEGPAVL